MTRILTNHRTAKITAVGKYLPEKILTNFDMEKIVDTNDAWIRSRTGISERRQAAPGESSSVMATKACEEIIKKRKINPKEIDCIIVATITPDSALPATACLVQNNLGAVNAFGYDLSAACSGFLYALDNAARMIESGHYNTVLVVGVEAMSTILDYTDRSTCILFGDGAGAVLLEADEEGKYGLIDSVLRCDGSGGKFLRIDAGGSKMPATEETVRNRMHFVKQDGKNVFKAAVKWMADVAAEVAKRNNLGKNDIDLFIPHQANKRIVDATARRLGLDDSRVLSNIEKYGNTTGATIPLGIYDAFRDGRLKSGDNVILAAFGAGYTWGAIYLRWAEAV